MNSTETKLYTTVLLAAFVLAVLLVFFIITIIRHQRINVRLYEQQIKAEINTLESERERLAADLHDDIGPLLSSVKLQIDCINSEDEEDIETVARVGRYMDEIMVKLRETSNNLLPRVLIKKGLFVAIADFVKDINNTKQLSVTTDMQVDGLKLPAKAEIHLYRIVQEITNNCIKYARAHKLSIEMKTAKNNLILILADDGKGFDFKNLSRETLGLGLKNILSRVDILKGEMYFDSKPGKGVKYTINVPIES